MHVLYNAKVYTLWDEKPAATAVAIDSGRIIAVGSDRDVLALASRTDRISDWHEGFGSAALLDEVAANHPVYLTAKSLHAGWANSAALRLAGITAATPDPKDGVIQRDTAGNPTGIVFESAMSLIEDAIPEPTQAEITAASRQARCLRRTAVQPAASRDAGLR